MSHRFLSTVLFSSLLLLPLSALARNSDADFRSCEQSATSNRENRLIDGTRNYHINWYNTLQDRRQRYFDSWGIENDHDRQKTQSDIDRDIRKRLSDLDRNYRNDQRNIQNDFRNDDRSCRDQFNARVRSVPVGAVCYSSETCRPPLGICSTELGECHPTCQPGSGPCMCTGRCRLR